MILPSKSSIKPPFGDPPEGESAFIEAEAGNSTLP